MDEESWEHELIAENNNNDDAANMRIFIHIFLYSKAGIE
jgi:hypothetical protein